MQPKISIIVPVYKVEQYLHECVNSILEQTFKDFELILIDDGSPDRSGKICDEYAQKDCRVKVIHKKNGGPSAARNLGIKMAKGDYIGFVDSDDILEKNMFNKMYYFSKRKNADIVACGYTEINHLTGDIFKPVSPLGEEITILEGNEIMEYLEDFLSEDKILGYACLWNKLYKTSFIRNNNLLINEKIKIGEDLCFNLKAISKASKFCAVNEALYIYRRVNSESIMNKKEGQFKLYLDLRQEILRTLKEINVSDDIYIKCLQYENSKTVADYLELIKVILHSNINLLKKYHEITRLIHEPHFLSSFKNFDNNYLVFKAKFILVILKGLLYIEKIKKVTKSNPINKT